jgi:hypothetical protein
MTLAESVADYSYSTGHMNPWSSCPISVYIYLTFLYCTIIFSTFSVFKLYLRSTQVKANEVGGACGTHGRGEKSVQGFGGKARGKETTWKTKA